MGIFAIVGVMFKWLIAAFIFFLIIGLIRVAFSGIVKFVEWFQGSNNYILLVLMAVTVLGIFSYMTV
jgi:hypothetical protein